MEGMVLSTPDGRIVAANAVACRMLGHTEAELCELARRALVVDDDAFRDLLARREREGHARGHVRLRRRDGGEFTADVSTTAFDTVEGPRLNVMMIDVTEQIRSRRALEVLAQAGRVLGESLDVKATLQRLMSIVVPTLADLCALDLLEHDEIDRFVVAHRDPTMAELVRVVRRRGMRNRSAGVEYVLSTGKPQLVKTVTEEFQRASTHDEEHYEQAKRLGVTSFVSVPLVARGRIIGAFTLASTGGVPPYDDQDLALVSALADQAALALENAREHAAAIEATRLRDEVLGVVSHDLKNPLNTIKLSASSLARHSDAEEVPVIRRAVQRAERLIQDLVLASKLDFAALPLDRRPTSVRAILDGLVALHGGAAVSKSLELRARIDGDDEVAIDRHRVAQMLDNLVTNAIAFTETGSVEIRARVNGENLILEVSDTGPGIAPEILVHVFDRFWQSAHAGRAAAGLGLAIARGVALAHGGDITVETALGRGTTFTATLPITPT